MLQRIAAYIRNHDWFAVVVEIFVIMVGLMLALQLDRWREHHEELDLEHVYIQRLANDIATDVPDIGYAIGLQTMRLELVELLMNVADNPDATNIGFFHEGVNLSKVWNLPVLWVCENNQYGMGTAVSRASAVSEIRQKAEGYGIPNERVEGMDVLEVKKAAEKALKFIREGNGPYFLEIMTYRFRGHSMGDPERYRESDEVKRWQENDPIGIYHKWLMDNKKADEEQLDQIVSQVEQEIEEAVEFAENSPEPAPEELFTDVYVEEV